MTGRSLLAPARTPSGSAPASGHLLQRKCACGGTPGPTGECAECRRKRLKGLQTKLRVGAPDDRWEREADRLAARVAGPESPLSVPAPVTPVAKREGGEETTGAPPAVEGVLGRPGRPLDDATREHMEGRFGRDFGGVRIHTDDAAARAARGVDARAFTVGADVAFGAGEYRPGTPAGRRLLAHELVHTLQQGGDRSPAAAGAVVQRETPSPDAPARPGPLSVMQTADRADASCDLTTLCRMRFTHPDIVSDARVARVVRRCRPGVLVSRSPCLDLAVLSPGVFAPPSVAGPTAGPGKGGAPAATTGGGLPDLSRFTKFELDVGDGKLTVDLPSSAKLNLPVEFRNSFKITFELVAKTSGAFSFSITLDGIPHVQLKSTTTTDVGKKSVSSELAVSSALKTCHAPSPRATKAALKKAGEGLKKAIQDVNKSDAQLEAEKDAAKTGAAVAPSPPEGFDRVKRLADVVSGIVDVKKAVDKASEGCKPQPTISFGITGQAPFDPSDDDAVPSSIIGGLTIRF